MCNNCNGDEGNIFYEPLTGEWYMDVETLEWDSYNDEYTHYKEYGIHYCPYCGRKLNKGER